MWILPVVGVLLMAFVRYRSSKQQGAWHWGLFLGILGSAAVFIGAVIVPLTTSSLFTSSPNALMGLMFGSIAVYVVGLIWVLRRYSSRWVK